MYSSDFFVSNLCWPGCEVALVLRTRSSIINFMEYLIFFLPFQLLNGVGSLIYLHFFMTALVYLQSLWSSIIFFSGVFLSSNFTQFMSECATDFHLVLKNSVSEAFLRCSFLSRFKNLLLVATAALSVSLAHCPRKNYNLSDIEMEIVEQRRRMMCSPRVHYSFFLVEQKIQSVANP